MDGDSWFDYLCDLIIYQGNPSIAPKRTPMTRGVAKSGSYSLEATVCQGWPPVRFWSEMIRGYKGCQHSMGFQ